MASSAFAQTALYKTNDGNDLGSTTSWTLATGGSGGNPSSLDGSQVATFDDTVDATNAPTQFISTSVSFAGISVLNPGADITISTGITPTITLGSSGITTSSTNGLTLNLEKLVISGSQTWDINSPTSVATVSSFSSSAFTITKTGTSTLSLGSGSVGASALLIDQGTIDYFGAGATNAITLNNGTLQLGANLATPLSCTTTGTLLLTSSRSFAGPISGGGVITANTGSSVLSLSGSPASFTGTLVLSASGSGTLKITSVAADNWSSATIDLESTGTSGLINLVSVPVIIGNLTGSSTTGTISLSGSTQANGALTVGALNAISTFAGSIINTTNFIKTGTGALTLTSTGNSYTGPTAINGGTLVLNGSLTHTSSLSVNNSGTLAGTGSITSTGTVTLANGGTIAPGSTLTLKNLTWAAGGTLLSATTDGVGSNLLSLGTGTLTKSGAGAYDVDFGGVTFSSPYTYTLITYGAESGYSSGDFTAVDATFGPNAIGTFTAGPTSLTYTISIVPEPSTFALLAGSVGLLAALRRRRALT